MQEVTMPDQEDPSTPLEDLEPVVLDEVPGERAGPPDTWGADGEGEPDGDEQAEGEAR